MSHVPVLSSSTVEYVTVRVRLDRDDEDPSIYDVEMALGAADEAEPPSSWETASWVAGGPPYQARLLVSSPDPGTYGIWVRVLAAPEQPVRLAGLVRFV